MSAVCVQAAESDCDVCMRALCLRLLAFQCMVPVEIERENIISLPAT